MGRQRGRGRTLRLALDARRGHLGGPAPATAPAAAPREAGEPRELLARGGTRPFRDGRVHGGRVGPLRPGRPVRTAVGRPRARHDLLGGAHLGQDALHGGGVLRHAEGGALLVDLGTQPGDQAHPVAGRQPALLSQVADPAQIVINELIALDPHQNPYGPVRLPPRRYRAHHTHAVPTTPAGSRRSALKRPSPPQLRTPASNTLNARLAGARPTINTPDGRATQPPDDPATGPSGHRADGPTGRRAARPSDRRVGGPPGHRTSRRTTGPPDQQDTRPSVRPTTQSPDHPAT